MSNLIQLFNNNKSDEKGLYIINENQKEKYISYNELYNRAVKQLARLQESEMKQGDELIFQIESEEEFIVTFWACVFGGIIPAPIPVCKSVQQVGMLKGVIKKLKNVRIYLEKSLVSNWLFLVQDEIDVEDILIEMKSAKKNTKASMVQASLDTTVFIQFSSGSTGTPKGVSLSHENIISNSNMALKALDLRENDRSLSWMPLTHNFGLIGMHIMPILMNMNQFIMPTTLFLMNPLIWMQKVQEKKITITASPNFGYMHYLNALSREKDIKLDLSSLSIILNGAEPVNDKICRLFTRQLSHYRLKGNCILPAYGMAEATLASTICLPNNHYTSYNLDREFIGIGDHIKESDDFDKSINVVEAGKILDGCNIRICNELGEIVDDGIVGHIQMSGKSIMKEYYNDEINTKKVFTEDKWLITGDVGFVVNNKLIITGRAKDIIFINGKNYYPDDFEKVISEIQGVSLGSAAVASIFNPDIQTEEVLVFLENRNQKGLNKLNTVIKEVIYEKMMVEVKEVAILNKIPRTNSGKIQRYKLLEMYKEMNNTKEKEGFIQEDLASEEIPNSEIEAVLKKVFSNILRRKQIGRDEKFNSLGINSLKASLIVAELNKKLEVNLKIDILFRLTNLIELSEYISSMEKVKYDAVKVSKPRLYYPVSSQQKRLYTINVLNPNSTNYNISNAMYLYGQIDNKLINEAFKTIIKRHEAFRTNFKFIDGEPVQIIYENVDFNVVYRELNEDDIHEYIKQFVRPFDLEKNLLIRVELIRVKEEKHLLLIDVHHIISDGSSMGYIIDEFCKLYDGKELSDLKLQYKDYALWQQEQMNSEYFKAQEEYWLNNLKGPLPSLDLPLDYERDNVQSFEGDRVSFEIDKGLTAKLNGLAIDNSMTLYIVLLSSYCALLSKYTMQDEILIGSPISGRSHSDFNRIVGMFVNTIVLRSKPEGKKRFIDYLQEVKQTVFNAYENQDYQFEWLTNKLNIQKKAGRNPIFDMMFNMQNMDLPDIQLNGITCEQFKLEDKTTRFDLILIINQKEETINMDLVYCTKLFKRETIENMKEHYLNLLRAVADRSEILIDDISILSNKEELKYTNTINKKELALEFNF